MTTVLVHDGQVGEVAAGQRAEVVRGWVTATGGTVLVGPGGVCHAGPGAVVTLCDTGDLAALMGASPPQAFLSGGRCGVEAGTAWVNGPAQVTLYDGAGLMVAAGARPELTQHGRNVEVIEVSAAQWAAALAAARPVQAAAPPVQAAAPPVQGAVGPRDGAMLAIDDAAGQHRPGRAGVQPDPRDDLDAWAGPLTDALEAAGARPARADRGGERRAGLPVRDFRATDPVATVTAALTRVDLPATSHARVSDTGVTLTLAGALTVQVTAGGRWLGRR